MHTMNVMELRTLREAAEERGRRIAERLERIEASRRRLWTRMDRLRAEMAPQPRGVLDAAAPVVNVPALSA